MNATDLSCIENLSANVGKRGARGITGAKGVPGTNGIQGVKGQPGPDGSSRIDVTMQGAEQFVPVQSNRTKTIAYLYYPGSTTWGRDIQSLKVACSFNKGTIVGRELKAEITLTDKTDINNPLEIFSEALQYNVIVDSTNIVLKEFQIVEIGDSLINNYVTIQNVPTGKAVLEVNIRAYAVENGATTLDSPILEVHAIELT